MLFSTFTLLLISSSVAVGTPAKKEINRYDPAVGCTGADCITDVVAARSWLDAADLEYKPKLTAAIELSWRWNTNITDANQQADAAAGAELDAWTLQKALEARTYSWGDFEDEMKREFQAWASMGSSVLLQDFEADYKALMDASARLGTTYSTATVWGAPLEPTLTDVMTNSRDFDELLYAWKGWRDATGPKMRDDYKIYVDKMNQAARLNNYEDAGDAWRAAFESDNFDELLAEMWEELQPMYRELHAFVREKLKNHYGKHQFPRSGHIPAHLLGNMWAQSWANIGDILLPFDSELPNPTNEMIDQNYTPRGIFHKSDEFFGSLGLVTMPPAFWEKAMLEKPDGREVVCHASAWNFYNAIDYRIKQCTEVTWNHFITAHHEMGHVEYYLNQPHLAAVFQEGANPGFHEAIGDTMSLSVMSQKHRKLLGFMDANAPEDEEANINFLMDMALRKVAFLPFGYLMDLWRWDVFAEKVSMDEWNDHWWNLRCGVQGVSPPLEVERKSTDFDPGSKYHIPASTPYDRYFVAHVLQFSFYEAMCNAAGHPADEPLYKCDFYNSTAAGDLLGGVLKLGSTQHWSKTLEQFTGSPTMSVDSLKRYFEPLTAYIKEQNRLNGVIVGFESRCPTTGPGHVHDLDDGYSNEVTDGSAALSLTGPALLSVIVLQLLN